MTSAVSTLQAALTSAITGLGTQFTSSAFHPDLDRDNPVVDSPESVTRHRRADGRQQLLGADLLRAVSSVVSTNLNTVNQTVATAIQGYNNSLV